MPIVVEGDAPPSIPGYTLKLGSLDLAEYLKVQPEDNFDPFDADFREPQFTQSPLQEGGEKVLDKIGNKELVWPLALTDTSKDELHDLQRQITTELSKSAIRAEWKDTGAAQSTFFDIVDGRLEPTYHYFRHLQNWGDNVLRLWVKPYGHTATEQVAATGAGTGVLLQVPIPVALAGDVPAKIDARITVGSAAGTSGRVVAFGVLPNPSYAARYSAASLSGLGGATLIGGSGAAGSQYLGVHVSPTAPASGYVAEVPLQVPSCYVSGPNRILAIARSRVERGVALRAFDHENRAIGATQTASFLPGWGLVDLGVFRPRTPFLGPTAMKLKIAAGALSQPSGASAAQVLASPGVHLNEVYIIPENDSTVFVEPGYASAIAHDNFERSGNLAGTKDSYGHSWATGFSEASSYLVTQTGGQGRAYGFNSALSAAARLDDITAADLRQVLSLTLASTTATHQALLRKELDADSYVAGRLSWGPSGWLDLRYLDNGSASTVASAAIPMASLSQGDWELALETTGGRGAVTLRPMSAEWFASVGASHARLADAGHPGISEVRGAGPAVYGYLNAYTAFAIGTTNLGPADVYNLDDANAGIAWRKAAGGDLTGHLSLRQRGVLPQITPSAPAAVAFSAPLADGVANDVLSVDIRVRERFSLVR